MRSSSRTRSTHHYYTEQRAFEQSLDVVSPAVEISGAPLPLVVLVVGSGWLGHRSFVYAGTSWWNSSGPKTIAKLGAVCVCVRHRGAFPPVSLCALSILATTAGLVFCRWSAARVTLLPAIAASLGVALAVFGLSWALWAAAARGSAPFDQMLHDIALALVWVRSHRATLPAHSKQLVFGGYSSGGHVASSLLQRPDVLMAHGLPGCASELCDGVLLLSGVLGTRPSQNDEALPHWMRPPRLFTDFVNALVWGEAAAELPSPIHSVEEIARSKQQACALPPHLLLSCRHEVFGLSLLDVYFCSKAYAAALSRCGVTVRYVELASDHWNVLNSSALERALRDELGAGGWPTCDK